MNMTASVANAGTIGGLLLDQGKITPEQAEQILNFQKQEGLRFGEAATRLGIVSEADIRQMLARQFDYPYLQRGEGQLSEELIAAYAPFQHEVENLRALRSQLMLRWLDRDAGSNALAITSPGRGEGRSWLAANLAIVFSQLGEKTLLIDADLRNPRQHALFGLDNRAGLSLMLADRGEDDGLQKIPGFRDLTVLASGPTPPNPQELLCCAKFSQLMTAWSKDFDVVLLDTSAMAESSDVQSLAARVGGVLVVARQNRTRMRDLLQLQDLIVASGTKLVGSVYNQF